MINQMGEKNSSMKRLVIGIGGAGLNVVNYMIECGTVLAGFVSVDFAQYRLAEECKADMRLSIGKGMTIGMGNGNPRNAEIAAQRAEEEICSVIHGAELVLVTCGLGGWIGNGAAPVIVQAAHKEGIPTAAVVSMPFEFEGRRRNDRALTGHSRLCEAADAVITVSNDAVLKQMDPKASLPEVLKESDEVICRIIQRFLERLPADTVSAEDVKKTAMTIRDEHRDCIVP